MWSHCNLLIYIYVNFLCLSERHRAPRPIEYFALVLWVQKGIANVFPIPTWNSRVLPVAGWLRFLLNPCVSSIGVCSCAVCACLKSIWVRMQRCKLPWLNKKCKCLNFADVLTLCSRCTARIVVMHSACIYGFKGALTIFEVISWTP